MRRTGRLIVALLAIFTMAASSPGWSTAAAESDAPDAKCAQPRYVPWVGAACPVEGGYEVTLPDGYKFLTHGPDYVSGHLGAVSVPERKPACVKNPAQEFHTRLIYAYPTNAPNKYSSRLDDIRDMVEQANGFIRAAAAEKGRRVDLRVSCVGGEVSVAKLKLPTTLNGSNFLAVIQALRDAGYSSTLAKYWVWLEGHPQGAPGGIATIASDDRPTPENKNNNGPSYNVTFGVEPDKGGAAIMLHEGSHNFGGVQNSAPYNSGGFHCNDGLDIMCYADGGSQSDYSERFCDAPEYDCRQNTYFNARPSSRSYLAKHWNLASPANRYFSGCTYKTGLLTLGAANQNAAPVADAIDRDDPLKDLSYDTHSISSGCDERKFVLSAVVAPVGEAEQTYGETVPFLADIPCFVAVGSTCMGGAMNAVQTAPVPNVDVCFYRGSKRLKCYAAGDVEQGTVPEGTTKARVSLVAGAQAIYVLNIV